MTLDLSNAVVRRGKITESDRAADYEFWRSQPVAMKFAAIWEMTVFYHLLKHHDPSQLRLDRTVGGFRKQRR